MPTVTPEAEVHEVDAPSEVPWTPESYNAAAEAGAFDGLRVQLIRGKVYQMPPMGDPHKIAATGTLRLFTRLFDDGTRYVQEAKPERLGDSEPEPDVAIVRGDHRYPTNDPADVLLVMEIADSSLRFDRTTKLALYAATGYREYWLLDLNGRRLIVHRDPRPDEEVYATTFEIPADGEAAPQFAADRPVRIADLLPPADAF